jgi:hypothetical protein
MIGRSEDQMIAEEEDIAFLTTAAGRPQIGTIHLGPSRTDQVARIPFSDLLII